MTTMASTALATTETSRLAELEAIVDRGLTTFVEVGRALTEIRDARLYRTTHTTFETYCKARWNFSASRGRQLIAAAAGAGEIESVTRVTVPSERHARELAPMIRARGAEAAAEFLAGKPTVEELRQAVQEEMGTQPATAPTTKTTETITIPIKQWAELKKRILKLDRLCAESMKARTVLREAKATHGRRYYEQLPYDTLRKAKAVPAPVQDAVAGVIEAFEMTSWRPA
jgi:hypothetical protein